MKFSRKITYAFLGIISIILIIGLLYFSALYDKKNSSENSYIQNHYKSRKKLIAQIETQKNIIARHNITVQSLKSKNSDLNQKNVRITDALYTKNAEIKSYIKKLEQYKKLDVFECKKSTTSEDNFKNIVYCLGSLRLILVEHYQSSGKFPTYLSDLSLKILPSENELIQEINFGLDGTMHLYMHSLFGNNKFIALTPEITQGGMVKFSCKTNLKANMYDNNYCIAE